MQTDAWTDRHTEANRHCSQLMQTCLRMDITSCMICMPTVGKLIELCILKHR